MAGLLGGLFDLHIQYIGWRVINRQLTDRGLVVLFVLFMALFVILGA